MHCEIAHISLPPNPSREWLSINEFHRRQGLSVHVRTLRRAILRGELLHLHIGKRFLVPSDAFDLWQLVQVKGV